MIAEIELRALARLKQVADAGGVPWRWRTHDSLPVDWDEYLASDAVISCPAVWIVFAGWSVPEEQVDDVAVQATFAIVVADENNRQDDPAARRHGGHDPAKEPGAYRLLLGAVASLHGQTFGLDLLRPLRVGPARPVVPTARTRTRRLSIFAAEMTCLMPIAAAIDGDLSPEELQVLHANWDIPALDDPAPIDADPVAPGVQLPDDGHADATDHLRLETNT
jgi:phage gp37-like protein